VKYEKDRFVCMVDLGNDAMRTPQHVAEVLRGVARALHASPRGALRRSGSVHDENGNSVGQWSYHWDSGENEDPHNYEEEE
jgi:hypothetical protein